jgi:hypothetical protein
MTDAECSAEVKIARLEEQVKASATALALAEKLTAAATIAARASAYSQWSSVLAFLALLVALWAAYHGR